MPEMPSLLLSMPSTDAQANYDALNQQLAEMQTPKLRDAAKTSELVVPQALMGLAQGALPNDVAAADSMEGKFKADGKRWKRSPGPIIVGGYVEDVLKERQARPKGRGWIGKVLTNDGNGALVDFGSGYSVGISLHELSAIEFEDDVR